MNTIQLKDCLEEYDFLQEKSLGVFSADNLPKITKNPCCFVANTHPSNKPGEHWVAFYIDKNNKAEYFDSYGMEPRKDYFKKYLDKNFKNKTYNKKQLQGPLTNTCGQYAICFLLHRAAGFSMHDFLTLFSSENFHDNDHSITDMSEKYFEISKPLYSSSVLNQFCISLGH